LKELLNKIANETNKKDKKTKLIKSPLNYTGGKYKLLSQILPLFPKDIDTFVDFFAGGFNVGINVPAKKYILNDIIPELIDLYKNMHNLDTDFMIKRIKEVHEEFKVSKDNKQGYLNLREHYNEKDKGWEYFYSLVASSFSNQIRFNGERKFNIPSGCRKFNTPHGKRFFNPRMETNFIEFSNQLSRMEVEFYGENFVNFDIKVLNKKCFVYLDPPYFITDATYNKAWNLEVEQKFLAFVTKIDDRGIKFALSNVIENKGVENTLLKMWSLKYNVHYLEHSYGNSSYQAKDRSKDSTVEVLMTNY